MSGERLKDRVRAILADAPPAVATPVDGVSIWRIDDPAFVSKSRIAQVRACRRALLDALADDPEGVYLVHADDPEDEEIPGSWARADQTTWRWPPDLELDDPATARWLMATGNWTAYVAPAVVESHAPDPFKARARSLLAWMRDEGVEVLVAVFPDGAEWLAAIS